MADKTQSLGKIAAGLVFICGAIGLLIHRMPRMTYVQAHADKPRPTAPVEAAQTAGIARPALPKVVARKAPAQAPAKNRALAQASSAQEPGAAVAASESDPAVDWMDSCSAEIGLLCYNVPERKLKRCLGAYEDALRKVCREALEPQSSSDNP